MKLLVLSMLAVAAVAAPQGYRLEKPSGPGFLVSGGSSSTSGPVSNVGIISSIGASPATGVSTSGTTFGVGLSAGSSTGVVLPAVTSSSVGLSAGASGITVHGVPTNIESGSGFSSGVDLIKTGIQTGVNNGAAAGLSTIADGKFEIECQEGEIRHIDGSCVVPEITRKVFVFDVPRQEQQPIESVANLPAPKVDHNILFVRLPEGGVGPEPIIVPPPRQENIIYVLSKQGEESQRVIEVPAHPASEPEIYFVNYGEGENPTLPGGIDLETALGSASLTGGQFIENVGVVEGNLGDSNIVVDAGTGFQNGAGVVNVNTSPELADISFGVNEGVAPVFEVVQTGRPQPGLGLTGTAQIVGSSESPAGLYTTP